MNVRASSVQLMSVQIRSDKVYRFVLCEVELCTVVAISDFIMNFDIRYFLSSRAGQVNSTDAPTLSSDELWKINRALVNCSIRASYTRWTDEDCLAN